MSTKRLVMEAYHELHSIPEVSWKEVRTSSYIKRLLTEYGCRLTTFADHTGVIGELGEGPPIVAVRADMDALWQEVGGEYKANHSCGHDAHMAMVFGVLHELSLLDALPKGTIRFIFQPAEEVATGALKLVEEGVMDDVDVLFGVHLRPIQELRHGQAAPAIMHGAARYYAGRIIGEDMHAARPHLGVNAIEVGAALVHMIQGIHADPGTPYSAKLTSFIAGGQSSNIIPGSAQFGIDLRAQTNAAMESLAQAVKQRVEALASTYGVRITLEEQSHLAAAEVHADALNLLALAIDQTIGSECRVPPIATTGGDDFHFYTLKCPGIKATMLGLGCDLTPGLHHPRMTFNHEAMMTGASILTRALLLTLQQEGERANGAN